jgi:preprotein translocase subunit SecG
VIGVLVGLAIIVALVMRGSKSAGSGRSSGKSRPFSSSTFQAGKGTNEGNIFNPLIEEKGVEL